MPFPVSPVNGQKYTNSRGTTFQWNQAENRWDIVKAMPAPDTLGDISDVSILSTALGRVLMTDNNNEWVDVEIVNGFGFNVVYDDYLRTLTISQGTILTENAALSIVTGDVVLDVTGDSLPNDLSLAADASFTLNVPTNVPAGTIFKADLFITQGSGGGKIMTLEAGWVSPGGVDPVLSTAQGAIDWLCIWSDGSTHRIGVAGMDLK
jgi:hypothetical protein